MSSEAAALSPMLRVLQKHLADAIHTALRDAGFGEVGPSQGSVLPFIPDDGIRVSDLATLAGMRKQSMAQAVEQLEAVGYVQRSPDPTDGRARLVHLTPRGQEVRVVAKRAGRAVETHWATLTSAAEMEALRASLTTLLAAVQRDAE
jgi:DNA-binding MarR family transcriptional regulator